MFKTVKQEENAIFKNSLVVKWIFLLELYHNLKVLSFFLSFLSFFLYLFIFL